MPIDMLLKVHREIFLMNAAVSSLTIDVDGCDIFLPGLNENPKTYTTPEFLSLNMKLRTQYQIHSP